MLSQYFSGLARLFKVLWSCLVQREMCDPEVLLVRILPPHVTEEVAENLANTLVLVGIAAFTSVCGTIFGPGHIYATIFHTLGIFFALRLEHKYVGYFLPSHYRASDIFQVIANFPVLYLAVFFASLVLIVRGPDSFATIPEIYTWDPYPTLLFFALLAASRAIPLYYSAEAQEPPKTTSTYIATIGVILTSIALFTTQDYLPMILLLICSALVANNPQAEISKSASFFMKIFVGAVFVLNTIGFVAISLAIGTLATVTFLCALPSLVSSSYSFLNHTKSFPQSVGKQNRAWIPLLFPALALVVFAFYQTSSGQALCGLDFGEHPPIPTDPFPFDVANLSMMAGGGQHARMQHDRQIACLRAHLVPVNHSRPDLDAGLFSLANAGKSFDTLLRFAGGSRFDDDSSGEAKGLSLKVFGVEDSLGRLLDPALETGNDKNAQSFVFLHAPILFMKDIKYYGSLMKTLIKGPQDLIFWVFGMYHGIEDAPRLNPLTWEVPTFLRTIFIGVQNTLIQHLPNWTWHSTTSYALGKAVVRHMIKPCKGNMTEEDVNAFFLEKTAHPTTFLRTNLANQLGRTGICLEFHVLPQEHACKQDPDNPAKMWYSESVKVAEIIIPMQNFASEYQNGVCQNLSFNPWLGGVSHKPLGQMNFARKIAYTGAFQWRRFADAVDVDFARMDQSLAGKETQIFDPRRARGQVTTFKYTPHKQPFLNFTRYGKASSSLPFSFASMKEGIREHLVSAIPDLFGEPHVSSSDPPQLSDYWKPLGLTNVLGIALNSDLEAASRLARIEFARNNTLLNQLVRGPFPFVLRVAKNPSDNSLCLKEGIKCTRLPQTLNVAAVNDYLASKNIGSFENLLCSRQIFYADYALLHDTHRVPRAVLYAPIVLFYRDPKMDHNRTDHLGDLIPIGIQLTRRAASAENEFYPADSSEPVWRFASMHVLSADSHYQMTVGLAGSLFALEPIALALKRGLSPDHPVLQWFNSFLDPVLEDCARMRGLLFPAPPVADPSAPQIVPHSSPIFDKLSGLGVQGAYEVMTRAYRTSGPLGDSGWNVHDSVTEQIRTSAVMKKYGHNFNELAFSIYKLVRKYAELRLMMAYNCSPPKLSTECDENMAKDDALQYVRDELLFEPRGNIPPPLAPFTTLNVVAEMLGRFLFEYFVRLGAMRKSLLAWHAFAPLRPLLLRKPMPHLQDAHKLTEKYIASALPSLEDQLEFVGLLQKISHAGSDRTFLEIVKSDAVLNKDLIKEFEDLTDMHRKYIVDNNVTQSDIAFHMGV